MTSGPVVLLVQESERTNALYHWLSMQYEVRVLMEPRPARRTFLARRVKRLGAWRVLGQIAFGLYDRLLLQPQSRERSAAIAQQAGLRTDPIPAHLVTHVPSANSPEVHEALRSIQPRTVVVHGTRILNSKTLACVPAPFLNIHAGTTPAYRGVHGGYWALVQGDAPGVTLHLVDEGIDTGRALAQRTVDPTPKDTLRTIPWLQFVAILPDLDAALSGNLSPIDVPPSAPSRLWSHPTLWQYLRNRSRGIR